ncbi:FkbM family methyltransferase [Paraburkholderia sp. GAS82]|uniref:FkbM family methyltransferase n=1 Tax=Paraburkholderia sp. GAS82 TaxID=3035137 RepID=UPI003D1E4B7F
MSFVSYAQNREDVMLRRALAGVTNGFYVDIGAQDPDEYSVTKTFYESGWRGINVEPVNHWYEKLVLARPDDINIRAMVGTGDHPVEFFEIEDTGLSTADKAQAEIHRNAGFKVTQTTMTPTRLDTLLATHNVEVIHFLKIDVEGSEDDVLRSIDLRTWRPWILVIEATIPMSAELADGVWQEYVEAALYEFVYFDGLNKYFVSNEKRELKQAFSIPPNVFDRYMTAGEKQNEETIVRLVAETERSQRLAEHSQRLEEHSQRLAEYSQTLEAQRDFALLDNKRLTARLAAKRTELQSAHDELEARRTAYHSAHGELEGLRVQLNVIQNSVSWRITRPLRAVRGACRNFLLAHSGVRRAWLSLRPIVVRVMRTIIRK